MSMAVKRPLRRRDADIARFVTCSFRFLASVLAGVAAAAVLSAQASEYQWDLPAGWPRPKVPADNPMSAAKVALGRHLFYDTRLSGNGAQSCATCHVQAHAFADSRAVALGSTGESHTRGSMSLVNIAYASTLTWGHPALVRLEEQALVPMFGEGPVELGLKRADPLLMDRFRAVPQYRQLFAAAFGASPDPFSVENLTRALASFERSIISARSSYDRYSDGDEAAISQQAKRGESLYFSPSLACFRCHGGFAFSQPVEFEGRPEGGDAPLFQNNGLYNLPGPWSYPAGGRGIAEMTGRPGDAGKFKPPTLRNIAMTAPYMHDGSLATLDEVLDHYAAGGRTVADGPRKGIGRDNPNKSAMLRGFALTQDQRRDLLAFLRSLTDEELLRDARFSDPWRR